MTQFESLFGIKSERVKTNCIFLPLLNKGILNEFGIKRVLRGKLYGTANANDFTLIHTGVGPGFVGDAVLHLKESPCRNMILLGSCGLVNKKSDLSLGSIVTPFKCYSNESFTNMLLASKAKQQAFYAHKELFEDFLKAGQGKGTKAVTCSTISSLKLEEELTDSFLENGIDVVDMECSAFFAAAGYAGLKAIALFYISDIIKEKPFYMDIDPGLRSTLSSSIKKAANLLCGFIQRNLRA